MTKKLFAIALLAFSVNTSSAHATGIIDFFFPKAKGPDPSQTLVAPFAEPPQDGAKPDPKLGLPENSTPVSEAHRPSIQIGEWTTAAVSEAMTFDKPDYKLEIDENTAHFDTVGKEQYMTFLNENSVTRVLESGKFNIRSFVQEIPLLLNEGNVDGSYRWLFQVPVMVSYMDRNMKGYEGKTEPVNQLIVLTVQVGRTGSMLPGEDIVIQRWSGKVQAIKKQ